MKKLEEIAELTAGVITGRVLEKTDGFEHSDVKVIIPRSIHDGIVEVEAFADEKLKEGLSESQLSKFTVSDGDIVMKFSPPYDAGVVKRTEDDVPYLVPSFCCKIALKDPTVDKEYLVTYLNSAYCHEELARKAHAGTLPLTKKSDLEKVDVPMLPLEKQKEIALRSRNIREMRNLVEKLVALENERNTVLFVEEK